MTVAQDIYRHLDTFTGGIEGFLAAIADESYESEVYERFHMTVLGDRALAFGFYTDINGEQYPDPEFTVTLGDTEADLDSLFVMTFIGGTTTGNIDEAPGYCAEFLEEVVSRKNRGIITLKDRVTPQPQALWDASKYKTVS